MKTTISTLMTFSILGLVATPAGALTAPRSSTTNPRVPPLSGRRANPRASLKPFRLNFISDDQTYSTQYVISLDAFEVGVWE